MQKNVLITGASTGIGFDAVRMLLENKFTVIATVRKAEDENKLMRTYPAVKVLRLDLTDLEEVENLPLRLLEREVDSLYGLVNNAGVALAGPFAYQPFEEVQQTMQINVIAVMKISQVLIPLLEKARGRIVNISSISGKSGSPFLAAYAASKHAIEGFSESLRKELMLKNIKVILIGPGSVKTPIWEKGFEVMKEKYSRTPYAESLEIFIKIVTSEVEHALPVEAVNADLRDALTSENPKFRYTPIPRKFRNWYIPMLIPAKIFDRMTARVLRLGK
jgi:short-subunit dehydrogenase